MLPLSSGLNLPSQVLQPCCAPVRRSSKHQGETVSVFRSIPLGLPTILLILCVSQLTFAEETIWQEGESPIAHKMNRHGWYDHVKKENLSGGEWISNFSQEKEGQATYSVEVKEGGEYALWLRVNPVRCRLDFQLNDGPWQEVSLEGAREVTNIAADGKVDLRFIGWVYAGKVNLSRGSHRLTFRFYGELQNHGALDAFVLTNARFVPRRLARPGSPETVAEIITEEDTWAFTPKEDLQSDDCLIDLRYLNEPVAGSTGFIRLSADGMSFLRGDGKPIRFWAVVDYGWRQEPETMARQLRWLAKLGVNMVRVHAQLCVPHEGAKITDVDERVIDQIQRYVAEAKKHGIYVTISPFWAHIGKIPASWRLEGYTGHSGPEGLLFFEPVMQEAYRTWVRQLYTRVNPYTGVPLSQEPAVAIIQVQNEDSLLFWTSQGIREPHARRLRKLFAEFLVRKYGRLEAAAHAWGQAKHPHDNFSAGEVGLQIIWHMTSQAPPPTQAWSRRLSDQLEFMSRLQYDFYRDMARFYRETLGCRQLINATNWKSADPVLLEDCERWTYTATDIAAVNRYTGVIHVGPNNGYRIDPGHRYVSRSCLLFPEEFPGALKQTVNQPMIVTETAWVHPGLYQTEGPFLAAAYLSLTGVDAFYWFSFHGDGWTVDPVWPWWKVDGLNSLKKWQADVPTMAGMFPAAALAFRLGYVREAYEPVVYEERSLSSMWERRVPIISEGGKFDPNRDPGAFAPQSPLQQELDRLAFFVGPVHVKFNGDEAHSRVVPLEKYIDRERGIVRSVTGEILLNWKQGFCAVDTPKFQGCTGFLVRAGRQFSFRDVTVQSDNDYATVMVVAMDDRPLRESEKVLVQVGTTARLLGWIEQDTSLEAQGQQFLGKEIIDTGRPPWRIAATKVTLTLANPRLNQAWLVDPNGCARKPLPLSRQRNGIQITLPADTMYVVLTH